jgi:hypothetical protein
MLTGFRIALTTFAICSGVLWHGALGAKTLFEETFNQAFLGDGWEVRNDSPDMRALDEGMLSVVTEDGNFAKGEVKNLLTVKESLKAKNADITLRFSIDIQEYGGSWDKRSLAGIAVEHGTGSYLSAYITNFGASYNSDSGPYAIFGKSWKGRDTPMLSTQLMGMKTGVIPFFIRLEKRAYKYTMRASLDGQKWLRVGTFALLNVQPKLSLFAFRHAEAGEAIVAFDEFRVTEVK